MKVTLNWLKQYVDFNWSPDETTERLTMLGLEVEDVQKISGAFDGVVVAQVITRDKHPNADKLSLCRVNDGQGERQIVCGAQNFKAGDKVPLILPGASLPMKPGEKEPFTIKVGKIRGVESHGMMCSPQELGLPEQVDGLLILREDAKVGQSFADYLGLSGGDVVYDLEVTPNRPDLNSLIGIAREIAAVTGNPLKLPRVEIHASRITHHASDLVNVRIEASDFCPRYTARVVKGVKIGPSPDWLRTMLEKVGIRSISNVVDVTNYVMLESGQPLHAFDYHLLTQGPDGKPVIVIRRAGVGEKFKTLDNIERTLANDMLLIADEQRGIALAGVMGGANTEINNETVDVLIESAYFSPTNIRRTSKALGLRSESSYRFERGADIGICEWASRRCAQLMLETAGGQLAEGVVDAYPAPVEAKQVTLRHRKVNELLGIKLQPQEMEFYLGQLGLKAVNRQPRPVGEDGPPEPATFQIPTWRVDLKRETDLIEEIERLHGLDKIPATPPRGAIGTNSFDAIHDQIAEARRILAGLGLNEAQTQTLIDDAIAPSVVVYGKDIVDISVKQPKELKQLVRLSNPMTVGMDVLRPSLLIGLLDSVSHNLSRNNRDIALFEIGRGFKVNGSKIQEERLLSIVVTGQRSPAFWQSTKENNLTDIYDIKGIVDEFLEQFELRGVVYLKTDKQLAIYSESASITIGGKREIGKMGRLDQMLGETFKISQPVFLVELNFDELVLLRSKAKLFKPLPQFPSIRRDVAMLVPETVTHDAVLLTVRQTKPTNLESVDLFDVFRGKHVPAGQKSLAYAFTYRSAEKTLTDAEVNAAHANVVDALKSRLQATVRE